MNNRLQNKVSQLFKKAFGQKPEIIIFSPGRINLIGEHTDYNKGFVFPAAINKGVYFAISRSQVSSKIIASDINDSVSFTVAETKRISKNWANYLLGVTNKIESENSIGQYNTLFISDIPIGAGLSSSAALSCGLAFALDNLFKLNYTKSHLALIAQWAEHNFVHVNCGLMDQLANLHGHKDHFLKIDMKNHTIHKTKWEMDKFALILFDSDVRHSHASSKYNKRRIQCERIVSALKKIDPEIQSLRDASRENLQQIRNLVDIDDFRKAKFVLEENLRVLATYESINHREIETIGQLLNESHKGLSEEYEVSCDEIDYIQKMTNLEKGCAGARIMGGGFGGCTLNLLEKNRADEIFETIKILYYKNFGKRLKLYKIEISDGTKILE